MRYKEGMRFRVHLRSWLWTLAVAGISLTVAHAEVLRSPWDGVPVAPADVAYACPAAPMFANTLEAESYYTDAHMSVIDPRSRRRFKPRRMLRPSSRRL